jgi:predicted ABC-type transport system involved in lysophospholipase L1 biosynthesis ATPase subunit
MDDKYITINEQELHKLKEDYRRAVDSQDKSFFFQGHELLTSFAKYYIEYIERVVLSRGVAK